MKIIDADELTAEQALETLAFMVLSVFFKVGVDYFAFMVSPLFGIYGVQPRGTFFSELYWISCALYLPVMCVFFAFMTRANRDILDYAIAFLFLSTYVPTLSLYWIELGNISYVMFCTVFWLVLFFTLTLLSTHVPVSGEGGSNLLMEKYLGKFYLFLIIALGILLVASFGVPSDLGFDSVYTRRKAFSEWLGSGYLAYLYSWSVYVFAIFLVFINERRVIQLIGVSYVVLFYAIAGDKVYLFLLTLAFFLKFLSQRGRPTFLLLAFMGIVVIGFAGTYFLDNIWMPAIVQRFLILPAQISYHYVDYFGNDLLLYSYSFLSSFSTYKWPDNPAQLIGNMFYTVGDNANVNFLVDAFVNLGWFALLPLLLFFTALRLVLRSTKYLILLVPLFAQAANIPLPTLLLTSGGGLMIITCYLLGEYLWQQKNRDYYAQNSSSNIRASPR